MVEAVEVAARLVLVELDPQRRLDVVERAQEALLADADPFAAHAVDGEAGGEERERALERPGHAVADEDVEQVPALGAQRVPVGGLHLHGDLEDAIGIEETRGGIGGIGHGERLVPPAGGGQDGGGDGQQDGSGATHRAPRCCLKTAVFASLLQLTLSAL